MLVGLTFKHIVKIGHYSFPISKYLKIQARIDNEMFLADKPRFGFQVMHGNLKKQSYKR